MTQAFNQMPTQQEITLPLGEAFNKIKDSKSILILLPQIHTADILASGLALYLTLKENYQDKDIQIISPVDVVVNFQRLFGVGSISKSLGSKNLVITLNTGFDNIEKITSDDQGGKFNLVIETKKGIEKIKQEDVSFNYRGLDADLLISIGINNQNQAGNLLSQEPNLFYGRDNIVISTSFLPLEIGTIKLWNSQASSVAEIVSKLLRFAKLNLNQDIATNLIAGIEAGTNNLTVKTNADTFAALSWCMKNGGRRNYLSMPATQTGGVNMQAPAFNRPAAPFMNIPQFTPMGSPNLNPVQAPVTQPMEPNFSNNMNSNPAGTLPQADWLQPKIFKAGENN
ncbi:hypothetical protein GYA19_04640 [Candidatus Beckwithbacteria bacterium]|nr:hypothetical protein [Candidatus Beckwithbacteria bacterium]